MVLYARDYSCTYNVCTVHVAIIVVWSTTAQSVHVFIIPQVLENELQALQQACEDLEHDYRPGITFLVVQKRHHTRFFPVNEKDKVI